MSAPRVDMHRLQELVRLYRMDTTVRDRARLLRMSTRTEQRYRAALETAGLLEGDPDDLPTRAELTTAVTAAMPAPMNREVTSSVDRWMTEIRKLEDDGVGPHAIWDLLRRKHKDFKASASAVKRAVRRIRRERGVRETDVVIPVVSGPGEIAQVDFGFAGRLVDPATGTRRKAWVFVMVLAYSRHMFAKVVFDQRASTWVQLHIVAVRPHPSTRVPRSGQALRIY